MHHLNELAQNDARFKVNVLLTHEARVISWLETKSILNHIVRNFNYHDSYFTTNLGSEKYIFNLIKGFDEDEIVEKQTFVLIIDFFSHRIRNEYYPILKKLQNSRKLDVVIYCYYRRCPEELWMPPHRLIITDDWYFTRPDTPDPDMSSKIKDHIDVIKEPTFAYQSILSRKDFFNETCLKGISKIYMRVDRIYDGYFKTAIAILRKVNTKRRRKRKEPLKFVFHVGFVHFLIQRALLVEHYKRLDPNLLFHQWGSVSSLNMDNRNSVPFQIVDRNISKHMKACQLVLNKGGHCYRLAPMPEFTDLKMKSFETADEVFELMNADLCERQNT